MAKFKFKMENILSIKYKLEEQAKAEYAVEQAKLRSEEEKLEKLEIRKENYQLRLLKAVTGNLVLLEIKHLEDGVENIKYNIKIQTVVVKNQEQRVAKARERLNEAMKERKTYEKLKEKAFERFKSEVNSEEQKEINELVSFRFRSSDESED